MPTVDLITFCHHRDVDRLHEPGVIEELVSSHGYGFNNVYLVYQRIKQGGRPIPEYVIPLETDDVPNVLEIFSIEPDQPKADEMTHGPSAPHYWKWHVINHLVGLQESQADYIVFSDSDCRIISQPSPWVEYGIKLLSEHPDILIVSPSDGGSMAERMIGNVRLTQNVSQQLFMCDRMRMLGVDFDVPWDWEFLAPGEPMQEYYYMLEGRLWRYMHRRNMWRAILPPQWRYWHYQW